MKGKTPLIMASERGHLEVVQALMAAGANKEARESYVGRGGHWEVEAQKGGVFIMR